MNMIKVGHKISIGNPGCTIERVSDVLFIVRNQHDEIVCEGGYFKTLNFIKSPSEPPLSPHIVNVTEKKFEYFKALVSDVIDGLEINNVLIPECMWDDYNEMEMIAKDLNNKIEHQ